MIDFKNLRPSASYPVYPPYHKGKYMEEYFYDFYLQNKKSFDATGRTLIPIFWTNVYITKLNRHLIQPYLNALPSGKYFTVSQHDDAVEEKLPDNTISFEAGGNRNGIPIPLICSPLQPEHLTPFSSKDIFCSFVGSVLPDSLRFKALKYYAKDKRFVFKVEGWAHVVREDRFQSFLNTTKRSRFTLTPRGYGAQSFRLYEVLQLNSIPVIVYDKKWFPFEDEINWNEFCVLVHESEIPILGDKLTKISPEQEAKMLSKGKEIYNTYFTMEGMCKQILKILVNYGNVD